MGSILDDLQVYSRRCALEASRHAEAAQRLRATDPLEDHFGADAKITAQYHALHQARIDAEARQAQVKGERARVAERGFFLARYPEEMQDDEWAYAHSSLLGRAHAAGLVTDRTD
jgi:hypothetical protein